MERLQKQLVRVLGVIERLSDGRLYTLTELSAEFRCTTRTIRRDMAALAQIGFMFDKDRVNTEHNNQTKTAVMLINAKRARSLVKRWTSAEIGREG